MPDINSGFSTFVYLFTANIGVYFGINPFVFEQRIRGTMDFEIRSRSAGSLICSTYKIICRQLELDLNL